jgi:hypothetical protein
MIAQIAVQAHRVKFYLFKSAWSIFLSALVLIFAGAFFIGNIVVFHSNITRQSEYAIFVAHSNLMAFLRAATLPAGAIPLGIFIWILAGLGLTVISRTVLGKIVILGSFAAAIPLMLVGFVFGAFVMFSPVDSIILDTTSFNLGYFDAGSGGGTFQLYDCDIQGLNCKTRWTGGGSFSSQSSSSGLILNEPDQQVEVFINGEVVYIYPVE